MAAGNKASSRNQIYMGACRCAKEKESRQRNDVMNEYSSGKAGASHAEHPKRVSFDCAFSWTQHPRVNGNFLHWRGTLPRSLSMIDQFLNLLASDSGLSSVSSSF